MPLLKLDSDETGVPKWQIALSIGGVVLIGAGVYYYFVRNPKPPKSEEKTAEIDKESPQNHSEEEQVSI